tara:strand:- start:10436 stop:11122 length:687 start_codon:yes stop_codon:yes gene_type:complete
MADQITKITIRNGTTPEKDSITLDTAELGYATDSKKVWVGDNSTVGGNVVGQKFYYSNFSTDLKETNTIYYAVSGDLCFDLNDTTLKALTGTDPLTQDQWAIVGNARSATATEGTVTEIFTGNGLMVDGDTANETTLTTSGTLGVNIDSVSTGSKPEILQLSLSGIKADWNVIYPIGAIIWSSDIDFSQNPTDSGNWLYQSGQIWEAAGTSQTLGSGASSLSAWKRTG